MPNFTYTTDIPDGPNNPSFDQPKMKTNTNSTDSIIEVDHYSFNDNLGGYHKIVDFVNQGVIPATPAGVGCQLLSGANNLIFANAQIPAGTFLTNSNAPPVAATKGSTFLAGGMIMQWGQGVTAAGVFNDTFTYGLSSVYVAFSGASSTGNIITNTAFISPNITVIAKTNSGALAPNGTPVYWMVIGVL